VEFVDLGTISFKDAYERQAKLVEEIHSGESPETVFLLEHTHVFTTGRRGLDENLISSRDHSGKVLEVVRINRGGDVTYHGPGQLVVYPLLDLRQRGRDLNRYLRSLEECVIQTVEHFGVNSYRRDTLTGVWTDDGKLASIGVGVRHWITMHGLALNVSTDLSYFELINPCGIPECPVTSLERIVGKKVSMGEVKDVIRSVLSGVFESVVDLRFKIRNSRS
jgi:lipoyl(octanoyl) transferase